MKAMEAFLASDAGKNFTPEQKVIAEKVMVGMGEIHNGAVDGCIDLVQKWGVVKQLDQTDDFKLLVEFLGKLKDESTL